MIRRQRDLPEPAWVLISQVDHARLSGDLAAAWSPAVFEPSAKELLPAIAHHDDGWSEWEQQPQLTEAGRPRDFTEMPLHAALEIHARSIQRCAAFGPLAAWVTSGHFVQLTRQRDDAQHDPAASAFVDEQSRQQIAWLEQWLAAGERTAQQAEDALRVLQTLDWMSLWLCVREQTEPESFELPGESPVRITPTWGAVAVSPWPFAGDRLELSVPARVVPARVYRDAADLAAEPGESTTLRWALTPAD